MLKFIKFMNTTTLFRHETVTFWEILPRKRDSEEKSLTYIFFINFDILFCYPTKDDKTTNPEIECRKNTM